MPDNVAPMLDDVPEPDPKNDGDDYVGHDDEEANVTERDEGAHTEHVQQDAEMRPGENHPTPGETGPKEANREPLN